MFFEIACAYFLRVIVVDENRTALSGATVEIYNDRFYHRKVTAEDGVVQLYLPPDFYNVEVSKEGFKKYINKGLPVEGYVTLYVVLEKPGKIGKSGGAVRKEPPSDVVYRKHPSLYRLTGRQMKESPSSIFDDPLNFVKLLPGVASRGPYTTDLYVRGGASGETAVFWDGAYFPSPYHFNSLLSVFIQDAVSSMNFYSGAFPASFGGVLSGVVDIKGKNAYKPFVSAELGLVNTYLTSGISKRLFGGELSFWGGLRRTYFDLVMPFLIGDDLNDTTIVFPNYLDLQGKLHFKRNDFSTFFEVIGGRETFLMAGNFSSMGEQNETFYKVSATHSMESVLWILGMSDFWRTPSWSLSPFVNLSLAKQFGKTNAQVVGMASAKRDIDVVLYRASLGIKANSTSAFWALPADFHGSLDLGLSFEFYPSVTETTHVEVEDISMSRSYSGNFTFVSLYQSFGFLREDYRSFSFIPEVSIGMRETYATSPYETVVLNPRLSLVWGLGKYYFLKVAYGKHNQFDTRPQFYAYLSKVENQPGSINPPESHHFVLGFSKAGKTSCQAEIYYKYYPHVYELDETFAGKGAALSSFLKEAKGYSAGVDFLLRHRGDLFEGWLTASLGMAKRYGDILKIVVEASPFGKSVNYIYEKGWFTPSYERRYVVNAVGILRLGRLFTGFRNCSPAALFLSRFLRGLNVSLSASFIDGAPYTPVVDRVKVGETYMPVYGAYNSDRLPPYRDVTLKLFYKGKHFGFYLQLNNLFNFKNIYSITYSEDFSEERENTYPGFYPSFGFSVRF